MIVAIVQTRMTSTRLPGKVLKPLAGAPLIRRVIERVARIQGIDCIAVALAEGRANDPVCEALADLDLTIVRGSEDDVLARSAAAARAAGASTVIRITSDCPLVDPAISSSILAAYNEAQASGIVYARTAIAKGFPLGFDTEVFSAAALYEAEAGATDPYEREHVTPYLWRRPQHYPALTIGAVPDRRDWRLVVDTEEDYRMVSAVFDALYPKDPMFGFIELQALFAARPELLGINAHLPRPSYVGLS
jgi:spore coat polysaccharide biosynthesis protein SpsF